MRRRPQASKAALRAAHAARADDRREPGARPLWSELRAQVRRERRDGR